MVNPGLKERLMDCLRRQTAFYDGVLSAYGDLWERIDAGDFAALLERQQRYAAQSRAFESEFTALVREQQVSGDLSPEERSELAEAIECAQRSADKILAIHEEALRRVGTRMVEVKAAWDDLRRGRDMLDKYRPGNLAPSGGAFIDREA